MALKKENINYIIVLMCAALTGLVLLQFYWVKNTLYVQEEFFDQAVARAMNEVANKIEKQQTADIMVNRLKTMMMPRLAHKGTRKSVKITKHGGRIQGEVVIEDDSVESPPHAPHQLYKKYYFNKNPADMALPEGPFVIDNEDFVRLDSQLSTPNNQRLIRSFFDSMMLKAPQVRVLQNIFKDVFIGDDFLKTTKPEVLSAAIKDALINQGIDIYYAFGIYNPVDRVVERANSKYYVNELSYSPYKINLNSEGIFSKPYYLSLYFPGKNKFLFRQMSLVLAASVVLILLIVFCFGYTVSTIVRQKKLSQMKTDFINNMTHEFKTPVSTILLASEALKDPYIKDTPERMNRLVNMIYEENNRIGGHVERVLQLAAMEKGNFRLKRQALNVHELINRVVQGIAIQAEAKQGTINTDLKATNVQITADELHLSNIIYNLLDNAIKYCRVAPQITVSTYNYREGILISVTDNAIGLSREQQTKIFEQFYRVPTGNVHDVKGFGLGLHYVKTIVEAHNGTIAVQSEKGKGSTFEVYLPQNIRHEQNENITG